MRKAAVAILAVLAASVSARAAAIGASSTIKAVPICPDRAAVTREPQEP